MTIKRILVVDDSATDRLYISEMLQKAGFEISTAEDGQDCWISWRKCSPIWW